MNKAMIKDNVIELGIYIFAATQEDFYDAINHGEDKQDALGSAAAIMVTFKQIAMTALGMDPHNRKEFQALTDEINAAYEARKTVLAHGFAR